MILERIRTCVQHTWCLLHTPLVQQGGTCLCVLALLALGGDAWADEGSDLLQGTDASAWATLTGTGKKYIYMIEFVMAIASYIATRKLIVFSGFVVISVAVNIVLRFAGQ